MVGAPADLIEVCLVELGLWKRRAGNGDCGDRRRQLRHRPSDQQVDMSLWYAYRMSACGGDGANRADGVGQPVRQVCVYAL